jgi:hypothetical protein
MTQTNNNQRLAEIVAASLRRRGVTIKPKKVANGRSTSNKPAAIHPG